MRKYTFTVGLLNKNEVQAIPTEEAKTMIADLLIDKYEAYGITLTECTGYYRMRSNSHIITEPSVKIEVAREDWEPLDRMAIITDLKEIFHQESIMFEYTEPFIDFK